MRQEGKEGPVSGWVTVEGGRVIREGEGGWIWLRYLVYLHENWTMKPVEIVLRNGGGEDEGEWWKGLIKNMFYKESGPSRYFHFPRKRLQLFVTFLACL
jgi:hypothetical protein